MRSTLMCRYVLYWISADILFGKHWFLNMSLSSRLEYRIWTLISDILLALKAPKNHIYFAKHIETCIEYDA